MLNLISWINEKVTTTRILESSNSPVINCRAPLIKASRSAIDISLKFTFPSINFTITGLGEFLFIDSSIMTLEGSEGVTIRVLSPVIKVVWARDIRHYI